MPKTSPRLRALPSCLAIAGLTLTGCATELTDADGGAASVPDAGDDDNPDAGGQDSIEDPLDQAALDALGAPTLPATLLDYRPALPAHFSTDTLAQFDNTPLDNPVTDAGATLGRVLFYDRRLSRNGEVSCASCHDAEAGFADPVAKSEGFEGGRTRRNAMPLLNLRYDARASMFWNERAHTLEEQVLMPIQDDVEMGLTLEQLQARIANTAFYAPLFEEAFGDDEVTTERIALAQFVRSIVSVQAPWDEGVALVGGDLQQPFPNFTDQENRGKTLFFGEHDASTRGLCGTCHLMNNPLAFNPAAVPGGAGAPPSAPTSTSTTPPRSS